MRLRRACWLTRERESWLAADWWVVPFPGNKVFFFFFFNEKVLRYLKRDCERKEKAVVVVVVVVVAAAVEVEACKTCKANIEAKGSEGFLSALKRILIFEH